MGRLLFGREYLRCSFASELNDLPMQSLSTSQLTFDFGSHRAVDSVSLSVPEGSIYGFLGPNGAGKTTTIRLLLGLLRPTSGSVSLFDQPLAANPNQAYARIGALIEMPSLYSHLSGGANLEITRRLYGADRSRIDRVLELVEMTDAADKRVKHYSLGMKQRLGLANALINDPELLILDEPTNGLDPSGIRDMRDLLIRLNQEEGKTIFISSHLLAEMNKLATHVGIIRNGQMIFQGSLDQLHTQSGNHALIETESAPKAKAILEQHAFTVSQCNGHHLEVPVADRQQVARINEALVSKGLPVYSLRLQQDDLEDVFLSLTQ